MVLKTFTIRDSKGEFYSPPFFQKTHGDSIVTGKHWETSWLGNIVTRKHRDWETWETVRDWGTCFPVTILSNILFQLDDKAGAMKEAARVLKEKGRLLIVDWQESFGGLGPAPHHVFNQSQAEALAAKCNFKKLDSNLPGGEHHYAILFEK